MGEMSQEYDFRPAGVSLHVEKTPLFETYMLIGAE